MNERAENVMYRIRKTDWIVTAGVRGPKCRWAGFPNEIAGCELNWIFTWDSGESAQ